MTLRCQCVQRDCVELHKNGKVVGNMKKLTIETAEELALKMRMMLRVGASQPLNMKTALRQLNIMTIYRPLSDGAWGLALKSNDGKMFGSG